MSEWQDFGYEGMAAKINRLAGSGSINCGIRNYLEPKDPVNTILTPRESIACVQAGMDAGTPFRYGTIGRSDDSYVFTAIVRSSVGEMWTIKYDYMIDGSDNHHFIKQCSAARITYPAMAFDGISCTTVTAQQWLQDIPEQRKP